MCVSNTDADPIVPDRSNNRTIAKQHILQLHPGPKIGTQLLEMTLEYNLQDGQEYWHKYLYRITKMNTSTCVAERNSTMKISKTFFLSSKHICETVTYNSVTFDGHIFLYEDRPVPYDHEEKALVMAIKSFATMWTERTIKEYKHILGRIGKIPEDPWRSSH